MGIDRISSFVVRSCFEAGRTTFALVIAMTVFFAPTLSYSPEVRTFCEEYGSMPIPLLEEESDSFSVIHPVNNDCAPGFLEHLAVVMPVWDENARCSFLGDVPHLPPWS